MARAYTSKAGSKKSVTGMKEAIADLFSSVVQIAHYAGPKIVVIGLLIHDHMGAALHHFQCRASGQMVKHIVDHMVVDIRVTVTADDEGGDGESIQVWTRCSMYRETTLPPSAT